MIISAVLCAIGIVLADLRWLRVAQREHYITGSVNRFDWRWSNSSVANAFVKMMSLVGLVVTPIIPLGGAIVGIAAIASPFGLAIRGRTSKLNWTRRMKLLASVVFMSQIVIAAVGILFSPRWFVSTIAASTYFSSLFVELGLVLTRPIERRKAATFTKSATEKLSRINPAIVAITGSFGKTSTKGFISHLLTGTKNVVASPASFNNLSGLSKTVNDLLPLGTEVFIAEMGTYGKGEITNLCKCFPPKISVLTAIGPVHLERFKSEEKIIEAKAEIFSAASVSVCVINVDDDRLLALADAIDRDGKKVWRVGTTDAATGVRVVDVDRSRKIYEGSQLLCDFENDSDEILPPAINVACAVAVALEFGISNEVIAQRVIDLPMPSHRQQIAKAENGVTVIDDTFNSNPASVKRLLEMLSNAHGKRKFIVSPGMVELGELQFVENNNFARSCKGVVTDFIVVGRTNRKALVQGARDAELAPVVVDTLPQAVNWVKKFATSGDVVAYVNDLPDHFP